MLKDFYEAVLPRSGNYCLFLLGSKRHEWASTIDELVDLTEVRAPTVQGIYFATASYIEPTTRTQANVSHLRSLRLDIDAGAAKYAKNPEGSYPSQRDALAASVAFFRTTGLPPSYIVSSGEGLHIYYCMVHDLWPTEWTRLATRLGQLCTEHGFKADPTVTRDTARILRPPGTLHPNGKRVTILKDTGARFDPAKLQAMLGVEPDALPAVPARPRTPGINSDVLNTEGPPKSLAKIIKNCPAMAEVARVKGDVQEPLWRAMLGVVKFTVEGEDAAHELSSGHPTYDPDETQRKYDAWSAGPTTCAEFSRNTSACASCEYRGKIKSPVMLGLMTEKQIEQLPPEKKAELEAPVELPGTVAVGMPWEGQLPDKFSVVKTEHGYTLYHQMKVEKETADGETVPMIVNVPVTRNIFWLGHWAEAAHDDDQAQMVLNRWDPKYDTVRSYTLNQSLTAGRYDLFKWLAGKGIGHTLHKKAPQAMEDYVRASLERIQTLSRRPKITDRFGIRVLPTGELAAAHGSKLIQADGTISEGMVAEDLRDQAALFDLALPESTSGQWGADVWPDIDAKAKRYSNFMTDSYGGPGAEKYALASMLALASPLMPFVTGAYRKGLALPPNGLSVSLYSRLGGKGKTSLAQAVMLAYGSPTLAKDGGQNGSTEIAKISKLSMWGTMPLSLEEMGNNKEGSVANLLSSIANGSGRERGKQRGGFTSSATWALIALITTNRSQRDMVAANQAESSAIQYRLLELNVENVTFSTEQITSYESSWADVQRDCAGAMGAVIQRLICERGVDAVNTEMLAYVRKAATLLEAAQDARFQYRALGAMLYLQVLLTKAGLGMFDTRTLVETFRDAFNNGIKYVEENVLPTDGVELLGLALADLRSNTLVTVGETNRGYDKGTHDTALNIRMPDKIFARHVTSMGWTYVSSNALRDWAVEHKVSERDIINDAKKAGVLVPPNRNQPQRFTAPIDLMKGMLEATDSRTRVLKVNTRKLATLLGTEPDFDVKETPNDSVDAVVPAEESGESAPFRAPGDGVDDVACGAF